MQIHVKRELLKAAGVRMEKAEKQEDLFRWSAASVQVEKKDLIVATNDGTRYSFVLNVTGKDMSQLPQLLSEGIRNALAALYLRSEVIHRYFPIEEQLVFTGSKGQKYGARLDRIVEVVKRYASSINTRAVELPRLNELVNSQALIIERGSGRQYPYVEMSRKLEEFAGIPGESAPAVCTLMVELLLYEREVWRKLVVPDTITFRQLHYILQTAFSWDNCHLFDFHVLFPLGSLHVTPGDRGTPDSVSMLDGDQEDLSDRVYRLSDALFEDSAFIIYRYDFGDEWIHRINVDRVLTDTPLSEPVCTAGEHDAPPEDSGGFYFEEFETDEDDEEDDMDELLRRFDLEMVNYRLKRSLKGAGSPFLSIF